jgi:hypothetical protein
MMAASVFDGEENGVCESVWPMCPRPTALTDAFHPPHSIHTVISYGGTLVFLQRGHFISRVRAADVVDFGFSSDFSLFCCAAADARQFFSFVDVFIFSTRQLTMCIA